MEIDMTVWLRDDTPITPVGDMIGSMRVGDYGGGYVSFNSVLAQNEIATWKRLQAGCEEQIKRLVEREAKKYANGKISDLMEPGVVHPEPNTGSVEALDGGYLAAGGSIEAMPASHRSAADVIEKDIPAPPRIEQTVRIPSGVDDNTPF